MIEESLVGYKAQRDIIKRKRDAMSKARDIVKKGIKKIEPTYEYEKDKDYWEIEKTLYDCKIDQDLLNFDKEITTIQTMIDDLEERLERMNGEENE